MSNDRLSILNKASDLVKYAINDTEWDKPKCCWNCKHLIAYNPEEDKCDLDRHIFEDRFILSAMRDKECPLDKGELKGKNNE